MLVTGAYVSRNVGFLVVIPWQRVASFGRPEPVAGIGPQGDDDERQLWGARNCLLVAPIEEANARPPNRRISKAIIEF